MLSSDCISWRLQSSSNWWPAGYRGTKKIILITLKFCMTCCQQFYVSIFPLFFKDFAIVYDVTMAAYNSKSSSSTMFAWARSYWRNTRVVHQVHTIIDQLSHGFVVDIFYVHWGDKEESDFLIPYFYLNKSQVNWRLAIPNRSRRSTQHSRLRLSGSLIGLL